MSWVQRVLRANILSAGFARLGRHELSDLMFRCGEIFARAMDEADAAARRDS